MKVKELIEELQKHDPELDVIINADHGQVGMKAFAVIEKHVDINDADEYMIENMWDPEDDADYSDDFVTMIEIQG